jgi:hypothetical protein
MSSSNHAMSAAPVLQPPPSNVVPLRWTARGFVRAGVVFTMQGGTVTVAGPPGREDLRQALLVEIERRAVVFVRQRPMPDMPWPRVAMPGVPLARAGACDTCGDALDVGRGGMCPICTLALQRVLRTEGRIP